MAKTTDTVEIGFDLSGVSGAPYFTLDDSVKGKLDSAIYTLGGTVFYDVTQYVKGFSVSRGKNRQLDRFNAGSLNVTLVNLNRYFDPLYTASPFYGQIVPRREVRVKSNGSFVFFGLIDDWNLDYDISGNSTASFTAYDGFSLLSGQTLTAGTATSQLSGARINAVLNDPGVNWSTTARQIDAGGQTLQADVVTVGTDVLGYINTIEASEPGLFFFAKNGDAVWKDRSSAIASSSAVVLSDDGTGIPYHDIQVNYGSELLYNQAEISRNAGGTAIADDLTSQATYGVRSYSQTGLLMNTDAALGQLAVFIVSQYAEPEYRFSGVQLSLNKLSTADQNTVLGLDIGSVCRIKFTPNKVGSAIDKYAEVIGISHTGTPDNRMVTFNFQTLDYAYLVLDDSATGLLDLNSLGW